MANLPASLESALGKRGPSSATRLMVQDELDDFESNFHADWYSGDGPAGGQECFDESKLLVEMNWWRYIPLVNMLLDGLNEIPMIPNRIEQLLTMLVTVQALSLGTATTMMFLLSYEEMEAAAVRFGPNGTHWDPNQAEIYPMNPAANYRYNTEFVYTITMATIHFMTTGMLTLGLYFTVAVTSFRDPYAERNSELLWNWWYFVRISIAVNFVLTWVGEIYLYNAVGDLLVLRYPNPLCAGKLSETRHCLWGMQDTDAKNPSSRYFALGAQFILTVIACCSVVLPSVGLIYKTKTYCKMQRERIQSYKACNEEDPGRPKRRGSDDNGALDKNPSAAAVHPSSETPEADIMRTDLASVGLQEYAPILANANLNWSRLRQNASLGGSLLVNELLKEAGIVNAGHRLDMVSLLRGI